VRHLSAEEDTRRLIEFVHRVSSISDPSRLLESIPAFLREVFPSEITLSGRLNVSSSSPRLRITTHPVGAIPSTVSEAFARHLSQHPIFVHRQRTADPQALRISDFITLRQLRQRALYSEAFQAIGVNYALTASTTASANAGRSRG
jgi:hypothetical protein